MNPIKINKIEAFQYTDKTLKEFYNLDVQQLSKMDIIILIDLLKFSLKLRSDHRITDPGGGGR